MYLKKHVFFHRLLIFIISAVMIFSLTSCAQQRKPIPQTSKSEQEQNKPPKELDDLSKAVEKLEKTLFDMHERSKKPLFIQQSEIQQQAGKQQQQQQPQGQQGQQQGQGQGGQGQQNQQQGGGGGGGSQGGSQGQQQGQQPSQLQLITPQDMLMQTQLQNEQMRLEVERANLQQFEQLKKDVLELHSLWNAFEAKAVNQFLLQSSLLEFETALNDLTKSVEGSNLSQSLLDVVQLYKYLPDFYTAYAYETPPEIGKIRFGAKKIALLTEKDKYPEAKETLEYMTGVWMMTRPRLPKENADQINQLEFSISDLKDAIEAKNAMVVKAKTEVILKIADELEKGGKK